MSGKRDKLILVAALSAGLFTLPVVATSIGQPPHMGKAMLYMREHQISHACILLLATPGKATQAEVGRSTGDALLDQKMVDSLAWEVDKLKRMKLADFPQDQQGRRVVQIDMDLTGAVRGRVLGCPVSSVKAT